MLPLLAAASPYCVFGVPAVRRDKHPTVAYAAVIVRAVAMAADCGGGSGERDEREGGLRGDGE
jgi:hypothetical protein